MPRARAGSMSMLSAEIAVLGAGPAGAIAARALGLAGVDTVLIDRGSVAGTHEIESLPASGAPLAQSIGLLEPICAISHGPAEQLQSLWRDEADLRSFEGDGPLLLPRAELHGLFRAEAATVTRSVSAQVKAISSNPQGAVIRTDHGEIACKLVIDARGRFAAKRQRSDLVALPVSCHAEMPDHAMWLEARPQGWIWACSLAGGTVEGAIFQAPDTFVGTRTAERLAHARAFLAGSESFAHASAITVSRPMAAGLSAASDPLPAPLHMLIGDAALARDPIASHGLVHAIRSGVQAAVAARTILDPAGDSRAARSFLRHKHREAVDAAKQATAQAYRDQARFQSSFWQRPRAQDALSEPALLLTGPVTLARPLTRAPVLDGDQIRWAPAIALSGARDLFTKLGPVSAVDIAVACRPSAPLQDIATRLSTRHGSPVVFQVLEHLSRGGAFVQALRSN